MAKKILNSTPNRWSKAVDDFINYSLRNGIISANSIKSYRSYLNNLDKFSKGKVLSWINSAMSQSDPVNYLMTVFNSSVPQTLGSYYQWKHALKAFGSYMIGQVNAPTNLKSIKNFDILACELIAKTAIFCDPSIVRDVISGKYGAKANLGLGNVYASWFNCNCRRISNPEKKQGYKVGVMLPNGIKLDDNTSANIAIKRAVLKGMTSSYGIPGKSQLLFGGFETCHIWDKTAYDEKYYSSLPNLVLIPRAIAGLTDHCDAVKDLLKYRSYDLFGAIPGLPVPARPSFYTKIIWR